MSKATRIKQAIRITVISTLVFYFGLIALLNLPAVQHRISTYAARELTRLTQAEVSIGNVDLGLLNRVVIQNVQIKDRQKKDMLGISRFSVKIDIPSLFRGKIRISSVQLFGLDARLNRVHPKAPLNCQFLIDTFASMIRQRAKSPSTCVSTPCLSVADKSTTMCCRNPIRPAGSILITSASANFRQPSP